MSSKFSYRLSKSLDIPMEDRSSNKLLGEKNAKVEEAVPLTFTGAESLHRINLLPLWHPRRSFFKWVVLMVSCLFSVGSYFAYDSIGVVEKDIIKNFNITESQFGLLYSVYSLPNIVLPFFGGILLDRIGLPIGTTACTLLVAIGALLVALSPYFNNPFFFMLAGRFIFGVGAETSYVAQNTICCAWFGDGKLLAFAMGIIVSAGRLGSFATFATNAQAVKYFGDYTAALWTGAFFASLSLVAGLVYMFLHYYAQWMVKGTKAQIEVQQSQPPINWREILAFPPVFYIASIVCCIYYAAIFPFQSTAVGLLVETEGLSEVTAGNYVSILPATSLVLSPIFGLIVDRIGNRVNLVLAGLVVLIPSFLLLVESWWPALISLVLIGVCYALVPAALWPCLPLLVEEKYIGTAFGLLSGFINAGLTFSYWAQGVISSPDGREEMLLYSTMVGVGFILTCTWLILDVRMGHICNRVSHHNIAPTETGH